MRKEIRASIGLRLREERERLDYSQKTFGELGNASMRTEQDWERGLTTPNAEFLAVAARHGVDVMYVLTGQRTMPAHLSSEEASLLDNYHHADKDDQAAARRILFAFSKQKAA